MKRTTKEEINGSALYFFKRMHVIIGTIILLVTQISAIYGSYYALEGKIADNTSEIKANSTALIDHTKDPDVHMTYAEKVHEFVPRGEYDMLKDQIDRLENKIDKLLDK